MKLSLKGEALKDAGRSFTHLIGDQEETWHQRFRFAQAEGRGQDFPLSFVNVPICPYQTPIEQNCVNLAVGGGLYPCVNGVEDVEDSLGVGDPQSVFLSRVSPIKTTRGGIDFWFHVPREVLSNVRCYRMWSDNGSRVLLLQRPVKTAGVL